LAAAKGIGFPRFSKGKTMKLSSIVCASIVALAMTAQGASAVTTANTSKSNSFKIGTDAGTTEADCTKKGGKVTDGRDGKVCALPETAQPAAATTIKSSKSNHDEKTTTPAPATTPSPQ
jgi:hypothetical protein